MSSGRSPSDPEIESVNPWVDLVSFHSLSPEYRQPSDILVKYTLGTAVAPTPNDWVGLFRTGWGTTEDYLCYVWAPVKCNGPKLADTYEVVFPAHQLQAIPVDSRKFQFLFVSRGNYVAGVSKSFTLLASAPESQDGLSQHFSYSLVGSSVSLDTQGFEDLGESCVEGSSTSSESFEMTFISHSSQNLPKPQESPDTELERVSEQPNSNVNTTNGKPVIMETIAPKRSYVDVVKGKQIETKATRDTTSLAGPFEDVSSVQKQLCILNHHPIVSEYMENKERSVVPYKPIFNIKPSYVNMSPQVKTIGNFAERTQSPQYGLYNCIQLELLPCCALCSVAKSLLEVYRRQLNFRKTELRDIKLDMVSLRKALEGKEEEIKVYERQQLKYTETDNTIEEVLTQMAFLKNDISNLLLQNKELEQTKVNLQRELDSSAKNLGESQTKCSTVETQLNDILFSLSLKGYNSVVDFTGKNINLSEVEGKETDVDGWQVYKNKRCGRLLAVINQQEISIKGLQSALNERNEHADKLQEEVFASDKQLQFVKSEISRTSVEYNDVKQSLMSSLKREEHTMRILVDTESEMTQFKYDTETREHYLLKQIHELKEELDIKRNSAVMSFTNRLVSSGLASVPDVCKSAWCANLCPRAEKPKDIPAVKSQASQGNGPEQGVDTVSWETEGPIAKQPKLNGGKKKATKRGHHDAVPKTQCPKPQRRTVFPASCPVCGVSFANAIDNRVIDEHLAFHDIYRV